MFVEWLLNGNEYEQTEMFKNSILASFLPTASSGEKKNTQIFKIFF